MATVIQRKEMKTLEQILTNLTEEQKQLLADTIQYGSWGDTDEYFSKEENCVRVWGYITDLAHKGGHFERRSLSNRFKSLFKALGLEGDSKYKKNDMMKWYYDWWQDGSGSILLIRESIVDELEDWAKRYNAKGQLLKEDKKVTLTLDINELTEIYYGLMSRVEHYDVLGQEFSANKVEAIREKVLKTIQDATRDI